MALGLSTRKALSILKEQLEAVLEGHLKERKKCLTWKVKEASSQGARSLGGMAERRGRPVLGPVIRAVALGHRGCLVESRPECTCPRSPAESKARRRRRPRGQAGAGSGGCGRKVARF